ncbi:MAG: hypothetical protein QOJ64_3349 [Acidobacteriota bacterium]|jgi:hypothetical protein|nr:hypothetical protein [Acidobacteriota bacterium]
MLTFALSPQQTLGGLTLKTPRPRLVPDAELLMRKVQREVGAESGGWPQFAEFI